MSIHSIYGNNIGYDNVNGLLQARGASLFDPNLPGNKIILPSTRHVALFDDFLGDLVADEWNFAEGTDSATSDGAIVAAAGGTYVLTPGDSAGTTAADGVVLNSELNWQAQQDLWFHARIKVASIASCSYFIGFTDTKALEDPIFSAGSANTLTSDSTDAVGFMFDTAMTDDNWWAVGVANNTDAAAQNLAVAPVAATYETLSIQLRKQVDNSVVAYFFRNGLPIGSPMAAAVTYNVSLTPVFFARPLSAAAGKTLTIDYVNVAGNRI